MADATFEDGAPGDRPLRLAVETADDLRVASALLQDAVGLTGEVSWMPRRHRLVILLNRFRWEDRDAAGRDGRPFERVRTALMIDGVLKVRARGLDPREKDTVFCVLAMAFEAAEEGAGELVIALAGDGELVLDVECLDLKVADLTRPWQAASGSAPEHGLDD